MLSDDCLGLDTHAKGGKRGGAVNQTSVGSREGEVRNELALGSCSFAPGLLTEWSLVKNEEGEDQSVLAISSRGQSGRDGWDAR